MTTGEPAVELTAGPTRTEDLGTNAARLPRRVLDLLGLEEGDPVQIEGGTALWARAYPAHPDDEGIDVVRVDVPGQRFPESEEGGRVTVSAAPVRPARQVEITAVEVEGLSADDIREDLGAETILPGDRFRLGLEEDTRSFDMGLSLIGLSLVRLSGRQGRIDARILRVRSTRPPGPVRLVPETEIRLRPPEGGHEGRAADEDVDW